MGQVGQVRHGISTALLVYSYYITIHFFIFCSLGTTRTVRPLSPASESRLIQLLARIEQFYQYHGINLRTCYEDFDRHHMGVVTESQVIITVYTSKRNSVNVLKFCKLKFLTKWHVYAIRLAQLIR